MMPAEQVVAQILATLAPASLEEVIRALAREKGAPAVAVASIAERLLAGTAPLAARERARARALLAPQIAREAARIPGLRVIEND